MSDKKDPITKAIYDTLISPNALDANLEPANVVDALYAIAHAINGHAEAVRALRQILREISEAWLEHQQDGGANNDGRNRDGFVG
jgi:hypothetical protein